MHYTGGLRLVVENLFRNVQITNKQFERLYKFTLLMVSSLTVVLFVYLGFTVWINSLDKPKSTNIQFKIERPEQNEYITVSEQYPIAKIRGTSENRPKDKAVRLFIVPEASNVYYPFDSQVIFKANGDWEASNYIGPIERSQTIQYKFVVVGYDINADKNIKDYIEKKLANIKNNPGQDENNNPGLYQLPNNSEIYTDINVNYTRQ